MEVGELVGGRFRIERAAKRGGVGAIYRAKDEQTKKSVALKLLARAVTDDNSERFDREARVLAQLAHPAIVGYVAHGRTEAGAQYLAMEWLEGESLSERLARGPLTMPEVVGLARRVADALAVAHARGLVHRDIKPGNIVLCDGRVEEAKLIDFGVARIGNSELTTIGLAVGTVGYMAPEQARGDKNVDARADVFSLGCVLYKCITGHAPFAGSNLTAVLAKTLFEEAPRAGEVRGETPAALDRLVARMLAKDPKLRPADGAALAREIAMADLTRMSSMPPSGPAVTTGEQHLVSVVMCEGGGRTELSLLERLRDTAGEFGARVDTLASGHLVVTLYGTRNATDQAAQAARCALAMQRHLPRTPIVLATGRGVLSRRVPVGQAIERAVTRLEATTTARRLRPGAPNEESRATLVALDDVTAGLLDTRFVVVAREDGLYLKAERDPFDAARTLLGKPSPFVGRARELGILKAILDACLEEHGAQAVLVTGAAGVGKSRLRYEFLRAVQGRCEVWIGRGDPMSRGSPLRMIAQALRHALGLVDGEPVVGSRQKIRTRVSRHFPAGETATRISEFLGELVGVPFPDDESVQLRAARADPVVRGDQMRRAFEEFVAAESQSRPLVLVLEDLHWGDQPTVDLIDQLLRRLRDAPLLVLALARPDVEDIFGEVWSKTATTRLPLGELGGKACAALVRDVLGATVDDETVDRVTRRAEGNAFFLEELIRAVADRGDEDTLPETVLAMVQSRLERLGADERRALRAAAVFGAVFWQGGVAELVGHEQAAGVAAALDDLVARELLARRVVARFRGEIEYVFRHEHVREAAYGMLTDRDRTLGHRLAGAWLEKIGERDALVLAEHYERGGDAAKAALWLTRAAEQALAGNDLPAAIARAERAMSGVRTREERGSLRLLQAEAHGWRGEHGEVRARAEESMRTLARGSPAWHEAAGHVAEACGRLGDDERLVSLGHELLELAQAPAAEEDDAARARRAIAALKTSAQLHWAGRYELSGALLAAVEGAHDALADREPAAAAWIDYARSLRAMMEGDLGENLRLKKAVVAAFERAGDERNACIQRVRVGYASLLLGAFAEGERVLRDALAAAERTGLSKISALAKHNLGLALARTGHLEEARRVEAEALAEFEGQGDRRLAGASELYLAWILTLAGDLAAAERHARAAVETQRTKPPSLAEALATLAWVLLEAARPGEALVAAREAEQLLERLGAVEDSESLIRRTYAEALHATGETDEARAAIARAGARLARRAEKIRDAEMRRWFLEEEPDNRRTIDLARAWGA